MASFIVKSHPTYALGPSDFNPGYIIDDAVFTNKNAMSVQVIQDFLNTEVPVCDRNHTGFTGASGTVYSPPWTCLKEYIENPSNHQNNIGQFNADGTPYQVPGGQSAAQIIWNAAQQYNINPEVILTTLEKESGIVSDTWPASYEYKTAMGYACPDSGTNNSANCNSNYFGFYNQVNNAAWQFNQYMANPSSYNFQGGVTRFIGYNPDSNCGGTNVFLQNNSTAALYDYTPYQPNNATINYVLGSGSEVSTLYPGCAAYGNINFFYIFNNWFGINLSSGLSISPSKSNYYVGDSLTASYTVKNNANFSVNVGGLGICARLNGANVDLGFNPSVTIGANSSTTISYTTSLTDQGSLNLFICSQIPNGDWAGSYYPYDITNTLIRSSTITVNPNPLITTSVSISPQSNTTPTAGQNVTASFTITNSSSSSVNIGQMALAVRNSNGGNFDFALTSPITISPNTSYTYSQSQVFANAGQYTFFVVNFKNGVWNTNYPTPGANTITSGSFKIY